MAKEPVARLAYATVNFQMESGGEPIHLAYQQKVSLARNTEKKELLSNDRTLGESVMEVETKAEYEFSTEVGDVSLEVLALAFKGVVNETTYSAGARFWNGKEIKESTAKGEVGDVILHDSKLYIVKEKFNAGSFDVAKCAPKTYPLTQKMLTPQKLSNTLGRIVIEGQNMATGKDQILVIPRVNLSFEGDVAISDGDFVKLSFKGKALKKEGEELFMLIDA